MKEDLMSQGHGQTLGDMLHLPGISIRSPFALRTGQLHFLHKLSVRLLQNDHYHLGVFVPGYGKTITALASFVIARHLKKAIEKAAKSVEGVESATWDKKKKTLSVQFDEAKTSLDLIEKAIIAIGYDTENLFADDEVYEKLHSCCKYDRKPR